MPYIINIVNDIQARHEADQGTSHYLLETKKNDNNLFNSEIQKAYNAAKHYVTKWLQSLITRNKIFLVIFIETDQPTMWDIYEIKNHNAFTLFYQNIILFCNSKKKNKNEYVHATVTITVTFPY